jgi:hypothetical protein
MSIYTPKQHPAFYKDFPHLIEDRTPYTYLIGWSKHNIWYYGRRTAKGCHPYEFFNFELNKTNRYETSSDHVSNFILMHGIPDVIMIRRAFNNISLCKHTESRVLISINAASNPDFLNKKNSDDKWDTTGVSMSQESNLKRSLAMVNKPKPVGFSELCKANTIGSLNPMFGKLGINNPNFGRVSEMRNVPKETIICPHCKTSGGKPAMKRWHFDNCKFKIIPSLLQ